jgi:hypothetical protein
MTSVARSGTPKWFSESRTVARWDLSTERRTLWVAGEIDECRNRRPGASVTGLANECHLQNYEAGTTTAT